MTEGAAAGGGWIESLRGIATGRDLGPGGHMSARACFPRFDDAAFYLVRAADLFYRDLHKRDLTLVTALYEIRYLAPIPEGSPYVIESAIIGIGRRSLRYAQKLVDSDSGEPRAAFLTVEVMFDTAARRSVPIPDDLRARIEPMIVTLGPAEARLFESHGESLAEARETEEKMTEGWTLIQRGIVTEDDIDFNRHMSVKAYFPKFDDAASYLLQSAGLFYRDLHDRNLAMATVLHKIRYLAEMNEGDPYLIEGAFVGLGRRSVRYVQKMINLRTDALAATQDTVESLFDFATRKSVPWPDDLRASLEPRLLTLAGPDKDHFDG